MLTSKNPFLIPFDIFSTELLGLTVYQTNHPFLPPDLSAITEINHWFFLDTQRISLQIIALTSTWNYKQEHVNMEKY